VRAAGAGVLVFCSAARCSRGEQSLDRCRKKRVPDLVTRVRRELQCPLRIADQLVGQRLRYGHAARNRGVECREDDREGAGRSLGSKCCHGGLSTERVLPSLRRFWLSEMPLTQRAAMPPLGRNTSRGVTRPGKYDVHPQLPKLGCRRASGGGHPVCIRSVAGSCDRVS